LTVRAPIETKVVAATAGAAVGEFVLWLLGVTVWHVSSAADHASQAVGAVPTPVSALILMGATALAGYFAPHTPRPAEVVTGTSSSLLTFTPSATVTSTPVTPSPTSATVMPPPTVTVMPPPITGGTPQ
jgi:hypothetical protein